MLFQIQNLMHDNFTQAELIPDLLKVDNHKHLLLIGPSGCGKSTLLNLISGLMPITTGDIIFNSQSYTQLSAKQLDHLRASNFGFIFQKLNLIGHLTALQNISLAQHNKDRGHIDFLLNALDLSEFSHQKAKDLSHGQAQRVAIARALANKPSVIFADEPTSALDDKNADHVMNLIFEQAKVTGASIIAATHDARIKERFDTVLEVGR